MDQFKEISRNFKKNRRKTYILTGITALLSLVTIILYIRCITLPLISSINILCYVCVALNFMFILILILYFSLEKTARYKIAVENYILGRAIKLILNSGVKENTATIGKYKGKFYVDLKENEVNHIEIQNKLNDLLEELNKISGQNVQIIIIE